MEAFSGSWDYSRFKEAFHKKSGLNLDCYKDKQMERRIRQLMRRKNKSGFYQFFQHLLSSRQEMDYFLNYLTINTSEFFRDGKVYRQLEENIFPELLQKFTGKLTVWSAGCSIGAEPYTVAILFDLLGALDRVQIIATDLDEKALLTAQEASYDAKFLQKTKKEYLDRYFDNEEDRYLVKKQIKSKVSFNRHNLLVNPPVAGCHLILCRNVFIYFKPETQHLLLRRFSGALKPGGFLVIGSSEYISNPDKFKFKKRHNTIYCKK